MKQPTHHTYQPRAYMKMLKREGTFRILKSSLSKDIRIWHNCEQFEGKDLIKNDTIYQVRYWHYNDGFAWKCSCCSEQPPEGLLGAYIMLDWKRATDEVASAVEAEPYFDDLPF